jgi:hypothetical protein
MLSLSQSFYDHQSNSDFLLSPPTFESFRKTPKKTTDYSSYDNLLDTFRNEEDDDSEQQQHQQENRLPVGLIDYAIVLGPRDPYHLEASHIMIDGKLHRFPEHYHSQTGLQSGSLGDLFSPTSSGFGLFSPSTGTNYHIPVDAGDIVLWDRYPRQDKSDFEMPSRVSSLFFFSLSFIVCTDVYVWQLI